MPTPLRHPAARRLSSVVAATMLLAGAGCGMLEGPATPAAPAKTGIGLPRNWLSTPRLFQSDVAVVALAATPSRLLASTRGPAPTKIVELTEEGIAQPFAPGFVAPPDAVCPLEVAPGFGSFAQDQVLAGLGSELWVVAPDGPATRLAALPEEDGPITGLAFDTVGRFGYELLALTGAGAVHRIDAVGRVRYVGSVGPEASGPSIASASFGEFAGRLLVGVAKLSEVHSIDENGTTSVVIPWSGVSGAYALPDAPSAFGSTGAALFVATNSGAVYWYPLADVEARGGQVLLSSTYRSGSGLAVAEPTMYRLLPFSRSMGPEIAASFVRRPAVTPVTIEILPGTSPKILVRGSTTPVPVALFASPWFSPAVLVGGELRLAGALPATKLRTTVGTSIDLNGDGRLDLLLQFRPSEMQLTVGEATVLLEGTSLDGERVRGSETILVQ